MSSKDLNDALMMSEQIRGFIMDDANVPKTPQTANISPWMGGKRKF